MLVHGVQLVGEEPPSPIFAKRSRPRAISPSNLLAQAALRRESLEHVRGLMDSADLDGTGNRGRVRSGAIRL